MSAREPDRWLKLKTKTLIKACGGLEEASRACEESCRTYSVPHLSRAQNVAYPDSYLPIDIVLCLEAYCGQPIVTQAMADARPAGQPVGALRDEVSDLSERVGDVSRAVRAAEADEDIDPREGAEIAALLDQFAEDVRQAREALARRLKPRAPS